MFCSFSAKAVADKTALNKQINKYTKKIWLKVAPIIINISYRWELLLIGPLDHIIYANICTQRSTQIDFH